MIKKAGAKNPYAVFNALRDAGFIHETKEGFVVNDPVIYAVLTTSPFPEEPMKKLETIGRLANEVGILAELLVADVVSRFDGRKMPGSLFGQDSDVTLPTVTRAETRVGPGPQIDVVGFDGPRRVIEVEVKWRKSKLTAGEAERVAKFASRGVIIWVISRSGFEEKAKRIMRDAGVWFSDAEAFNRIRATFGLPEVKA